jgi:uncharacterized membrane protein
LRKELWELVRERAGKKGLLNSCLELYKSWTRGSLELDDPDPPSSFSEYLTRLDYSLWLWTLLFLISATIAVVVTMKAGPLVPLRYVLGTIFVIFLPGYALIEALYPREEELEPLERLALSIGLSLALVPLVGLILNYTPFGIRLYPVLISLALLTACIAFIGAYRKHQYVKLLREG